MGGRARGKHGTRDQYLYHATGESQREGHEEEFAEHAKTHEPHGTIHERAMRGNSPRRAVIAPPELPKQEARDREYGREPERRIPGGKNHDSHAVVQHEKVPAPEPLAEFRGMMAHGVPPEHHGTRDREHPAHHQAPKKPEQSPEKHHQPVPVVIVDEGAGARPLRMTTTLHFQAPAAGSEPVLICGQDERRHAVYLLNEGASGGTGARVGNLGDLTYDAANSAYTGGALLPNAMTSYLKLEGQSQLYIASADSHQPVISVITETSIPGAG